VQTQKKEPLIDERQQVLREIQSHPEFVTEASISTVESLRVGNILDAQDYLGNWHCAIVVDESST
jgi:hypothetical protein